MSLNELSESASGAVYSALQPRVWDPCTPMGWQQRSARDGSGTSPGSPFGGRSPLAPDYRLGRGRGPGRPGAPAAHRAAAPSPFIAPSEGARWVCGGERALEAPSHPGGSGPRATLRPLGSGRIPAKFLSRHATGRRRIRSRDSANAAALRNARAVPCRAVLPCGSPGRLPQRPLRAARPAALPPTGAAGPGGPVGARAAPAAQAPAPSGAEAGRGGAPQRGGRRGGAAPAPSSSRARAGAGHPAAGRRAPNGASCGQVSVGRGAAAGGGRHDCGRGRRRALGRGGSRPWDPPGMPAADGGGPPEGAARVGDAGMVHGLLPEEVSGYFSQVRCRFPPACCGAYRRGCT